MARATANFDRATAVPLLFLALVGNRVLVPGLQQVWVFRRQGGPPLKRRDRCSARETPSRSPCRVKTTSTSHGHLW